MAERVRRHAELFRHGRSTERTVFFSDAVFAIAMTLLVLDLKVPELPDDADSAAVTAALVSKVPALVGFMLSFVLVGTTWVNHHRRFEAIVRYDSKLQVINLLALFFVAFLPVPTSTLFELAGNTPIPPMLYAATIAGIFLSLNWLWRHAYRAGLMDPRVDEPLYRLALGRTTAVWTVFLVSIPVAVFFPSLAMYLWTATWPLGAVLRRVQWKRFAAAQTKIFQAQDATEAAHRKMAG